MYNYSVLLNYKKNNENKKTYLDKFYITNNIAESLHGKINYYLPKSSTTPEMFIISMKKILINDSLKKRKNNKI